MLYQEYANKIKKIAKVEHFVYRFRFVFIGAISLALATTITLLSVKGAVNDTFSVNQTYQYGEKFTPTATAVMGNAYFEYKEVNASTWSDVVPSEPGSYLLRSYSYNGWGGKVTGKQQQFNIVPRDAELIINENSITYGEQPTASVSLLNNDYLAEYNVVFDDISKDDPEAEVDPNSVVIYDQSGKNVTYCYNLIPVKKTIDILPRDLKLTFLGGSKTYDGSSLSNNEYTMSGDLAYDDELILGESKVLSANEFTTIKNERDYKIINKQGKDVTNHYNVNTVCENLTLEKQKITITSNSVNRLYDGTYLSINDLNYEITNGSLVNDDYITVDYAILSSGVDLKRPLSTSNTFTYEIKHKDGSNADDCYDVTTSFGTLVIDKQPLEVSITSLAKYYDGISYTKQDVDWKKDSGALLACDQIVKNVEEVEDVTEPTDSPVDIKATLSIENIETGEDVTDCYDFVTNPGTFSIHKRKLFISLPTYSGTYDGNKHDVCYDDGSFYHVDESISDIDNVAGDIIYLNGNYTLNDRIVINNPQKDLYKPGVYSNKNTTVSIIRNDEDVTDKYYDVTVSYDADSSNIEKRNVDITTKSYSKVYDGSSLDSVSTDFEVTSSTDFASGDTFAFDGASASLTNVGSLKHSYSSFSITNSELGDVTDCYNVTIHEGTLTVSKRPITITLPSYNGIFDGKIHALNQFTSNYKYEVSGEPGVSEGHGLLPGHDIYLNNSFSIFEVGSYSNKDMTVNIFDGDVDVTGNYQITYETSTSIITPRSLDVGMPYYTGYYDGNLRTLSDDSLYNFSVETLSDNSGLLPGHLLTFNNPIEIIDANKSETEYYQNENKSSVSISADITGEENFDILVSSSKNKASAGYFDVSDSYQINYAWEKSHISKRPITVTLPYFNDLTYDGNTYTLNESTPTFDYESDGEPGVLENHGLLSGHQIKVSNSIDCLNVGTYNVDDMKVVIKESDKDVTSNYDITYIKHGDMKIDKRPIDVTLPYFTDHIYDGNLFILDENNSTFEFEQDGVGDTLENHGLISSHQISIVNPLSVSDVGTYNIDNTSVMIKDSFNTNVTSNYDVNYIVHGDMTISKRAIQVTLPYFDNHVYDGEYHYLDNTYATFAYEVQDGVGVLEDDGMIMGHTIYTNGEALMCHNVGTYNNDEQTVTIKDGNKDVTSNYDITYIKHGDMEISKRDIDVTLPYFEGIFDTYYHALDNSNPNAFVQGQDGDAGLLWGSSYAFTTIDTNEIKYIYQAGEYDVSDIDIKIYDSLGRLDNSNYNINYTSNNSVISKKDIDVYMPYYDGTYDGYEHTYDNFDTSDLGYNAATRLYLSTIKNAGDYDTSEDYITIFGCDENYVFDESVDITSSYNINYIFYNDGLFTVAPASIVITMNENIEKIYDGFKLSETHPSVWYAEIEGGAVGTDSLLLEYTDDPYLSTGGEKEELHVNATVYDVTSQDVSSNYNIQINEGTYDISNREISIEAYDQTKYYDTTENIQQGPLYYFSTFLANGDKIDNLTLYTDKVDPGTYEDGIAIKDVVIKNIKGENVTDSYNIDLINGDLTINKPLLLVDLSDTSFTYDGQSHGYEKNHRLVENNLRSDFEFYDELVITGGNTVKNVSDTGTPITYGTPKVIRHYYINNNTEDVTSYYDINFVDRSGQTYTVSPANVSFTSTDQWKQFDGSGFSQFDYQVADVYNGVIFEKNYQLVIDWDYESDDCHVLLDSYNNLIGYTNSFTITDILDSNGNSVMENYNISYTDGWGNSLFGTLIISPLELSYYCASYEQVYKGESIQIASLDITQSNNQPSNYIYFENIGNLPGDFVINVSVEDAYILGAGSYDCTPEIVIYTDSSKTDQAIIGQDIMLSTKNGQIHYEITPTTLIIKYAGGYVIYTGEAADESLTISGLKPGDTLYIGDEAYNLSKMDYAVIEDMIEAGIYDASYFETYINPNIKIIHYDSKTGEYIDVTDSYIIASEYQTLIIIGLD